MKEMWNERYGKPEYAYGEEPNEFFRQNLNRFKEGGKILFPADGEGRNSVFAGENGFETYAFDISEEGKKKAVDLAEKRGVTINYEVGDFMEMEYQRESFDGVVLIYTHFPPPMLLSYHKKIVELLKPEGLVLLEGFSTNNLPYREKNPQIGGPMDEQLLFTTDKIEKSFEGLTTLLLEEKEVELNEGLYHVGKGRVVRYIGKK